MIPGETIKFNLTVSINGSGGRDGNLMYGYGCYMYVGVNQWSDKGSYYEGGNLQHIFCNAGSIEGKKHSNSATCSNLEWKVVKGRTGVLLHLSFTGSGWSAAGYRFIYRFDPERF